MAESVEQLDPTQELTTDVVKKRAVRGAAILTGRNILIQAISFFSTALLTVFLLPSEFGVFFLVSAVINFMAYFGDIGFAAALIQKKDQLTEEDLKTVFTAQQVLVVVILIAVFIMTPLLQNIYNLDYKAILLLWALGFSLLMSSLKTIPTVLMERRLEFNKYVVPQIAETIIFNITAVLLAWMGFGVTSYTVAVILRSFSGLIITYFIQPWIPSFSFSKQAFKSVLKFGVPYQANTLLAMVKDDGMILFLGSILGPSGVGLLGWAQKWAYAPLRFFMDQVIKVTFPAFSRLQDQKQELSNAVSKSIFFVSILVFPSLVMLNLLAPTLVEIIPKYTKWNPALTALLFISVTSALASITTPLTNTLNAIGKISITFRLMIMWTVTTWIFVPFLTIKYGLNGAATGFTIVGLTSVVALFVISKYVSINYIQSVGKPVLATITMGLLVFFVRSIIGTSLTQVILMVAVGLISYTLSLFVLEPNILASFKKLFIKKAE
ncbi:oligosaccharide flippase family protein [Candidatus Daviesbacteria bacterium]|nr:oligosaccharide flippase family protein [Candidatus Daviesbacteria bacterium]